MAKENRVVRPFRTSDEIQSWFDSNLKLKVQAVSSSEDLDEIILVEPGETRRLDAKTLIGSNISIDIEEKAEIESVVKAWKQYASEIGDESGKVLSIVLYGSSPYLKFTEELYRWEIDSIKNFKAEMVIAEAGKERPRSAQTAHHGAKYEIVMVLNEELEPESGLPWRKGSWIARCEFTLGSPLEGFGFNPIPLDKEKRRELGIGNEVFKYAQPNPINGELFESDTLDDFVHFYVDEESLARLSAFPRHPQSALIQTEIFLSAIEYVVLSASANPDFQEITLSDLSGTLLDKLIRQVSVEKKSDMEKWLNIIKKTPEKFISKFEDSISYKSKMIKSIGEMQ